MSEAAAAQVQKDIDKTQVDIQRMTQDAQAELQDLQNELQDLCARVLLSDTPVRCGVVIFGRERLRWRDLYDEPDNDDRL